MSDIFGAPCEQKIGRTILTGGRGGRIGSRYNWDTYLVDGKVRRLSVAEARKMMGIPKSFMFPVSETQAMRQLGNGVAVPAVKAVAQKLLKGMQKVDLYCHNTYICKII